MGLSLDNTEKAAEDASAEEDGNCMEAEASEEDEESDEGASAVKVAGMGGNVLGCHTFNRCCRGRRVFVSVQKSNHYMLHTNPNC